VYMCLCAEGLFTSLGHAQVRICTGVRVKRVY
jgi:hypothetical protein